VGGVKVKSGLLSVCEGTVKTPTVGALPVTVTEIFLVAAKKSVVAACVATTIVEPTPLIEKAEPTMLTTAVSKDTYVHKPVEFDVGGVIASALTPHGVVTVDQAPSVIVGNTATADAGDVDGIARATNNAITIEIREFFMVPPLT